MVFSSTIFLFVFLPFFLIGYFASPWKWKNIFLFLSSLFFYFWGEPRFIVIMLISILINYLSGVLIGCSDKKIKLFYLGCGIVLNLSILFIFKYLDFSITIFNHLTHLKIKQFGILLPIGISFFTFQGISYIIDVYRGETVYQKNPLKIGLYISLFPQLIAGPIVRYSTISKEIDSRKATYDDFYDGITRFIFGLAKKVLLANRLAETVDLIFKIPAEQNTCATLWLGIIFYTLQIYFDFSGYSDMAIGLGRILGFHFNENFNYPYLSKSISEFWRRWHISLSSWFKDYLYVPLGGNRTGNVYFNLFVVFLCTGIWHGAAMSFVVWGLWHGFFIIIEKILRKHVSKKINENIIISFLQRVYTLLVVIIGWVFFRADSIQYALTSLKIMFGIIIPSSPLFSVFWYFNSFSFFIFFLGLLISMNIMGVIQKIIKPLSETVIFMVVSRILILILFILSSMFVIKSSYNPFIYFRF